MAHTIRLSRSLRPLVLVACAVAGLAGPAQAAVTASIVGAELRVTGDGTPETMASMQPFADLR